MNRARLVLVLSQKYESNLIKAIYNYMHASIYEIFLDKQSFYFLPPKDKKGKNAIRYRLK